MRKHGGTPSLRDRHIRLAANSPPGVARGRFVGGQQSGLAGCKPPPLFTRGASSCSSQRRRQGEPKGASPRLSAPTYLPSGGWCGCGLGWRGRRTWRPPCPLPLLQRPPARRSAPARGLSPVPVVCWGPRRGRPGRWRGSPGPWFWLLALPHCSALRLRWLLVRRPGPAPGPRPALAARRGPRSRPRRGLLGLRSRPPVRLGPSPGAGRQGLQPGRRGRPLRPAQVPRSTARYRRRLTAAARPAARPAPPPLPAAAPRAPRVSPPRIPGRRGSGSGTGGGGGRPAGGSHRSPTSCYPGRHAWRQVCPSHHLPVYLCCVLGSAVQCSAGGRGGVEGGAAVALSPCGGGPAAIHRHSAGRRVTHAAHTSHHSSQSGPGLRALGPRGSSGGAEGSRTRWTPVTAVTSCVRRKVCTPFRAARAGRGGQGTGAAPYRWVRVNPRTRSGSPRIATTRRSRGVGGRSCQRTCPLWWAPLVPERGGGRCGLAQPRGACVAGGRAGHQAGSLGNASHTTACGGVGQRPSYTGFVGRERAGASSAPSTKTVTSPTPRSSSGGCRRWSAVSSSDTPPGYVARAWFRYGAVSPGQCVLRACSRAGALLWRDMADPAPVSCRVSPMDRGQPDWLDVHHSIQCP